MEATNRLSTLMDLKKLYNVAKWQAGYRCWFCGEADGQAPICAGCGKDLARTDPVRDLPALTSISQVAAPFLYTYPLDHLIKAAKFQQDRAALALVAHLVKENVSIHLHGNCDVVAIPMTWQRYSARGFNHGMTLAEALAKRHQLTFTPQALKRIRHGPAQSLLDESERRANLVDAFLADRSVRDHDVIIVDDVITTGATMTSAATALTAAGARQVLAVALAVSPNGRR